MPAGRADRTNAAPAARAALLWGYAVTLALDGGRRGRRTRRSWDRGREIATV